ncbi:MAG: hypothetical protein Satyrvirus20_10 [Satyrvirus sp.]|uniref:SAM domain-containing protein n=1 Tax=Satyrvirus sp. TaxID=2487771 RepID=A0A3G5AI89_9VIRU|nr:MAG: hypothetical protein Satyrvirus20_10 [Satyrvirus sp.]
MTAEKRAASIRYVKTLLHSMGLYTYDSIIDTYQITHIRFIGSTEEELVKIGITENDAKKIVHFIKKKNIKPNM